MDEIWERAVETALDGQTDMASVRVLTLDSAVKCVHGRLPAPSLFDKFPNLQHLSIANIGVSTLQQFPKLRNLQKLILSDNRISGGLEFLVEAGLESLRDLDLSNNRICDVDSLRPLAELRLVSLDLYECPVTRVKDYRSIVFGLIRSLRFLDKMDVDGNEKAESDEEDEEEDVEEEDDDEDDEEEDPGSEEIDREENRIRLLSNGNGERSDGVVEVDEDEESDADEEETETVRGVANGSGDVVVGSSNGFRNEEGLCLEDEDDDDDEEYGGEEDEDEVEEEEGNDDVVEVQEVESDNEDEDCVEDEDEEDEEVDNNDMGFEEPGGSNGRLTSTEGEIDGHEQGEEDADEDDDGETGEEELDLGENGEFDDEDEEEDNDNGYLVQPVGHPEVNAGGSDVGEEDEEDPEMDEEEDDDDGEVQEVAPSSSLPKRKRDDSDDDDGSDEDSEDDDIVEPNKSSKRR